MHVRTEIHAGQVNSSQLASLAGQFGLQVTPEQIDPYKQLAAGMTTPDQFVAVVSK